MFQLAWMYLLWKKDAKNPAQAKELNEMVKFVPYYGKLATECIISEMS